MATASTPSARLTEIISRGASVMILAPHPDDECLGTGGLIQQVIHGGGKIHVTFITNGDNNPWPQRYVDRRWSIGPHDRQRWGQRRKLEAQKSLQVLGNGKVTCDFLELPDAGILKLWQDGDRHLSHTIAAHLSKLKPDLLVTPCEFDRHSDHRATQAYAIDALKIANHTCDRLTYLIHRPWGMKILNSPKPDLQLSLTESHQQKKLQAIQCHETQMALSRSRFCKFAKSTEPFNFHT